MALKNPTEAAAEAVLINALATTTAAYASQLMAQMASYTQVTEGVIQTMDGLTGTSAALTSLVTTFLPAQVANALAKGYQPTASMLLNQRASPGRPAAAPAALSIRYSRRILVRLTQSCRTPLPAIRRLRSRL